MMKIYKSITRYLGILVIGGLLSTVSCVDYLDKAPEVDLAAEDVYSSFTRFQGFMEDIYQCVVDVTHASSAEMSWNFAGDELLCTQGAQLVMRFQDGNYWEALTSNYTPFNLRNANQVGTNDKVQGYWGSGWFGIRKANQAIGNIDKLVNATQEERDIILGQAYFFRAYLHFEILRAWGHIAYVDSVYAASDAITPAAQSYKATADRIEQDLLTAIPLLPENWDNTTVGQTTLGRNAIRVTKGAAMAYLAFNRLYAASPLMNGEETGNFNYNEALCKSAAEAYLDVINLHKKGVYDFETWEDYYKNFYTMNGAVPLGKEIIWSNPIISNSRWNYGDFTLRAMGGWGIFSSPTENYVQYFGMKNGLPLEESDSGYDPSDPWTDRDPRFYYNIITDGERIIQNVENEHTFAQFFVGGLHMQSGNSLTGYAYKKFKHVTCNTFDNLWSGNYFFQCPKIRLAAIYLEYAEAVNEVYGPEGSIPGGPTAIEAVNIIRARAGVPDVDPRFFTKEKFRDEIRRERFVELAFEAHRWNDLRRWRLSDQLKYREKYVLEFDKDHTYFNKRLYATTVFEPKHWWLPFPVNQVALYPEFKQNPGW
jgi:SusD family.